MLSKRAERRPEWTGSDTTDKSPPKRRHGIGVPSAGASSKPPFRNDADNATDSGVADGVRVDLGVFVGDGVRVPVAVRVGVRVGSAVNVGVGVGDAGGKPENRTASMKNVSPALPLPMNESCTFSDLYTSSAPPTEAQTPGALVTSTTVDVSRSADCTCRVIDGDAAVRRTSAENV